MYLDGTATRKNCGSAEPPACKGTLAEKSMLMVSNEAALTPELPSMLIFPLKALPGLLSSVSGLVTAETLADE